MEFADVTLPNWHNTGSAQHIATTFVLQVHISQETND